MADGREMFDRLRHLALSRRPADVGVADLPPHAAYGVVMDLAVDTGFASVVAFSTGDASVYLSSGGGFIGGASHERVNTAAKRFVAAANHALNLMVLATDTPLPAPGTTRFSVLSADGIFTVAAPEDDLGEQRSALSPLFYAGQDVITAYREIEQ
jgi:hypothetical protein